MAGESLPVWQHEGWRFFVSSEWDPAAESFERLGDLATNIAEDVIYLETAEIVRHR